MSRGWNFLRELGSSIAPAPAEDDKYIEELTEAHEEWIAAQNYFENVVDPDLIDYAIYKVEASRRKYMYMLKQAKANGVTSAQLDKRKIDEIFS